MLQFYFHLSTVNSGCRTDATLLVRCHGVPCGMLFQMASMIKCGCHNSVNHYNNGRLQLTDTDKYLPAFKFIGFRYVWLHLPSATQNKFDWPFFLENRTLKKWGGGGRGQVNAHSAKSAYFDSPWYMCIYMYTYYIKIVPYRIETQIEPSVDLMTLSHNRRVKQLAPKVTHRHKSFSYHNKLSKTARLYILTV